MVTTYTSKFRLAKTSVGNLDWWKDYWNVMDIVDKHIPRVMMSAPRVLLLTLQAGGSLTASRYYYYKVIAFKDSGATIGTLASWELTRAFTDATNKTIKVNWSAVIDINGVLAKKYRVYRYDNTDPGIVPLDSAFLYLATVSSPTTSYTDTGAVSPSGAMPTTLNWDVTEIKPIHVIRELESTPGAPITIVAASTLADNLTNLRYMIKLLNGETAWNASPYTSFAQLRDGKSGGQTIVGGTGAAEKLILKATISGSPVYTVPTTAQIIMLHPINMQDNILYGSAINNASLTLQASSGATNNGTIFLNNNTNLTGKILYGSDVALGILPVGCLQLYANSAGSSGYIISNNSIDLKGNTLYGNDTSGGNLILESTIHATKGQIQLSSPANMLGNKLYGSNVAYVEGSSAGCLILESTFHATKGQIHFNNPANLLGNKLYGNNVSGGTLTLESTSHATKGTIILNDPTSAGVLVINTELRIPTSAPATPVVGDIWLA